MTDPAEETTPLPRISDSLDDDEPGGLRCFNIGLVPASVTPPRTWKQAAWFAVLSSAGVLIGLTVVAAKLVGAGGPTERIGMPTPRYPVGVPVLTGPATETAAVDPQAPQVLAVPAPVEVTGTGWAPTTGPTRSAPVEAAAPQVLALPGADPQAVGGAAIVHRTERFYEDLATDRDTALGLTSDVFRSVAEPLFDGQLADVSQIEVTEIEVDPVKGVTVSTLQVTRKDGTTSTEKRELVFTSTDDPLIDSERPTGSA